MDDDVIPMQLTCTGCGRTVQNDLPRSQMPDQIAFLDHLRAAGWRISALPDDKHACLKCASSG